MDVAVVIPLFNGAVWIEETLRSVYSQQQQPKEVVVVDDGSTDDSARIVSERFAQTTLLPNKGKGSSLARNVGIERTSSPFLAFLDQDDFWHPSHLGMLSELLAANADVNCVVASADCFSGAMPCYSPAPQATHPLDPWKRFPFTMGIEGPSVAMFRREFLAGAGSWQVEGTGMGDILLFLKAAVKRPIICTASVTVGKRVHAHQQWLRVRARAAEYLRRRTEVTRLALDFRRATLEDGSSDLLERRWMALSHLTRLVDAVQCGDNDAIPEIARSLEPLLDEHAARHACYCLMGALFPVHDAAELKRLRDRSFGALLDYWPSTAPTTYRALRSLIGEDPVVS